MFVTLAGLAGTDVAEEIHADVSAALQANQLRKEASDAEGSGESELMPERKEPEREDDALLQQLNEMGFTDVAETRALLQQLPGQTSVTK